ncbi:MAG TPA: hypothetical protein VM934_04505 [Pyrinomonadaceae bacterium]|jgi:hypothetical protein|nr:hypothetical protein [Pyrinomonadaceae bacterium]
MLKITGRNDARVPKRAVAFLLLLLGALPVTAADASGQASSRNEQTSFGLEEPVRRPAPIPQDVLRGLGQDERVQSCLARNGNAAVEIPASWFVASNIHLNADKLPDLIVKPENACLFGANIGPFWVFRNTGRGYALALRVDTLGLEVLPARTRGYRNIRTTAASARQVFTRVFRFNGQSYQGSRR